MSPRSSRIRQLYQRLLTSNRDEADVLLEGTLRQSSLREVCDIVIVPALRLLEADFARGALKPVRRRAVLDHFQQWVDELLEGLQRSNSRGISWQSPSVLCVVAEDEGDSIVAKILAAVLIHEGISARVVMLERVEEEIAAGQSTGLDAVVVSALPPDAIPPARAAVKRIHACGESLPVIVGLWGLDRDFDRAVQRLGTVDVSLLQTRVAACVEAIERLRHTPGPSRAKAPPRVAHGS